MPRNGEERAVRANATQPEDFETFYREHLPFVRCYLARRVSEPFVIADLTAEIANVEWVDWFNHRRLYRYCGDIPPADLEHANHAQNRGPADS